MIAAGPDRENLLREAREQLIAQGLVRASVPESLVPEEIEQSWRRSVSNQVDPAAVPHVLGEFDPDSAILRAAGRILDQWQTNLTQSRMALFLADEAGRIVSRRIVDAQDGRNLDRANAVEGFDFSERALGTNGLGTSIEARGAVFVQGSEHFNEALSRLACAGAPIMHPVTGRVVGSLSLASHVDVSSPLMVALVRQAGQQIAGELETMTDHRDLDLARAYRRLKSSRRPVLVLNAETVMTDLPALAHLDAESHAVLWEELRHHRWDAGRLRLELPVLGTEAIVRRLNTSGQDDMFALEFVQSARDTRSATEERPSENAVPVLREVLDTESSHRTRPSPYTEVPRRLSAAAATAPGLLRVVGPPGVGKRYQTARWLRHRTGQAPVVLSGHDLGPGEPWQEEVGSALRRGKGVIVEGGNGLTDEVRRDLTHLATRIRDEVHPGVRIVLTEPSEAGGNESWHPEPPTTVEMPALARVRADIPAIVRDVASELFPGAPAPRFSPAALQRILAWTWPENVAELSRTLSDLPQVRWGELIQVRDLPAALRQSPDPRLSRYELAERETIVVALRETGGNKSQAAHLLGIGRATLYRKIRLLKIDADEQMIATGP